MRSSPLLQLCLKLQLIFAVLCASLMAVVSLALAGQFDTLSLRRSAALAAIYGITAFLSLYSVRKRLALAPLLVLCILLFNLFSTVRLIGLAPELFRTGTVASQGSVVCMIWFSALTAGICAVALIRRAPGASGTSTRTKSSDGNLEAQLASADSGGSSAE